MKYRKLRIEWSVAWGVLAELLVALWARSYWWWDVIGITNTGRFSSSLRGWVYVAGIPNTDFHNSVDVRAHVVYEAKASLFCISLKPGTIVWNFAQPYGSYLLKFPTWFPAIVVTTLSAMPWVPWAKRFSLRTLLVATTLVAVGLGLIVWLR